MTIDSEKGPVIFEGPQNGYVVKNQPAQLLCKASNADKIIFKCNGEWANGETHLINFANQPTVLLENIPYLESTVKITRQEVESFFGKDGFLCHCYAYSNFNTNNERHTVSEPAEVKIAYLRKHFEREPMSERKAVGETVLLSCLPPEGEPKPEIFWLKNDKEVESRSDKNLIIAHDGSLIIALARLNDTATYVCGARNLISNRLSQPAVITVSVDGAWSEWSAWSRCFSKCIDLLNSSSNQRRGRFCDNPIPVNGGKSCAGDADQSRLCSPVCPEGAKWSEWSRWSVCDKDCRQKRFRTCESFSHYSGKPCIETENAERSCTTSHCLQVQNSVSPSALPSSSSINILLFGGLGLAVLLLILALLCLVFCLTRNKKLCKRSKKRWLSDMSPNYEVSSELLYAVPDSIHSDQSDKMFSKKCNNAFQSHSAVATPNEYEIVDERTNFNKLQTVHSTILLQTLNLKISKLIDKNGGTILLEKSGVKLYIPCGSLDVDENFSTEITVSIVDDQPLIVRENSFVASPTVSFTSSNESLIFKKPIVLTIPTFFVLKKGREKMYKLSLFEKSTKGWISVITVGEETLNSQFYIQIDENNIHILTERLGVFALVCDINNNCINTEKFALKTLNFLSFFTGSSLNCFILPSCNGYSKFIMDTESEYGSILISSGKMDLEFSDNSVVELSLKCNNLSLSMGTFSHNTFWQMSNSAVMVKLALNSFPWFNLAEPTLKFFLSSTTGCSFAYPVNVNNNGTLNNMQTYSATVVSSSLSLQTIESLSVLLDPATENGNDWRLLAKLLSYDRYLRYFAAKPLPTESILNLFTATSEYSNFVNTLIRIFKQMKREDCVEVLMLSKY